MNRDKVEDYNPFGKYSVETPEVVVNGDLVIAGSLLMSEDSKLVVEGKVCWNFSSNTTSINSGVVVSGDLEVLKGQSIKVNGDCFILGFIDCEYSNCKVVAGMRLNYSFAYL